MLCKLEEGMFAARVVVVTWIKMKFNQIKIYFLWNEWLQYVVGHVVETLVETDALLFLLRDERRVLHFQFVQ